MHGSNINWERDIPHLYKWQVPQVSVAECPSPSYCSVFIILSFYSVFILNDS